ncbi:cytochrome P450 [Colletotrichum graminicola]|uniref:Cytochrome P450 n=1 Tax=Colletotrichum graminicola (strain M1.001 / M2 / FGSC 10212) TaxID=645133 RepID=E3QEJ0_COLGM|nr:cytochrome P450 [Colletotrichum graminicola M1.001]EFQ29296.1 cytochrome P450 [Colletotrichum graminicola M1.001]WDK13725.1 cytochrome P450 [Colletotrichum graminicola]
MAGPPWRAFLVGSAAVTVLLALRQPVFSRCNLLCAFLGLFAFQIFAWTVFVVLLFPQYFSSLRSLPGPKDDHWLMGQGLRIMREPTGVPMIDWVNNIPHEGVIRYRGLFNQERLLITSPKALAEVLVTHNYDFRKPGAVRSSIGRILGIGVLLAEGDEHKVQRKNLMPAFAFRHVKDLYPLFWSKACEGVEAITEAVHAEAANGPPEGLSDPEKAALGPDTAVLEIGSWASRTTLDIIGMAGMGRDFGAIRDPSNPLAQTYKQVFKPSRQAQLLTLLGMLLPGPLVHHLPFQRNGDIAKAADTIRTTCRELIREKQDKRNRKELTDIDILSVALESGYFTEENLVDQMMTFLAAGHETTAAAMMWAVYCLCLHPDVQTRLRREIRERLPAPGTPGDITALDIDHMPYLNAVCNEVLRFYSPVPMTLREAAVDTVIDGNKVPKGTRIMLCPWATNKDTSLWGSDAGRFDPERWLVPGGGGDNNDDETNAAAAAASAERKRSAASGGATSNYAFMTFLHGPRSCIGQGFAKAEFACILASWIGRFEFSLRHKEEYDEKNLVIKGGVTARPSKGLDVYVKVVDGW